MGEINRKIEEILGLPKGSTEPVKDGDKLVQELRDKAKERDRRFMEYLLVCPRLDTNYEPMAQYKIDGSEETFNWN